MEGLETQQPNESGLYAVTLPSGREMLLRPLKNYFFILYDELPNSLTAKTAEALRLTEKNYSDNQPEESLEEITKTLNVLRNAVKYVCVKPRIELKPTQSEEMEISPRQITVEDFQFLSKWAIQGFGDEDCQWKKFLENDTHFLRVASLAQRFGKLPSEIFKIENPTLALNFDLACDLRLAVIEGEKEKARVKGNNLAHLAANAGEFVKFDSDKEQEFLDIPEAW